MSFSSYSINYNTDTIRCYILDIDILLTSLTNQLQNFKVKDKKTQEYYINELYNDTDELISYFHQILDTFYNNKDIIKKLVKMLNYIRIDYNNIIITFNNILQDKENQENSFLLILKFWSNKRIYKHHEEIMSYNEILNYKANKITC